jgi:small ligand-binding sensory domain FIST
VRVTNDFSVVGHWAGGFDEKAIQEWAASLRQRLQSPRVSLGLVFMTPRFFAHAEAILEILRLHGQIPLLVGCSSGALIAGGSEIEENAGIVLALYALPGAALQAHYFDQEQIEQGDAEFWPVHTGISREQSNGWLVFADPFHLDAESWMSSWNAAYAPVPVLGGLASGDHREHRSQVYLNGQVFEEGGVALNVSGDVKLVGIISQGCTPIGDTWTLTKVEQNIIHQIGNRNAYEVLVETVNALTPEEQLKARGNLFIGLVVNEYADEFHRGDFLVRNLLGGDPNSGVLAVGALPRAGQTIQFQRRDAAAANEDMTALLDQAKAELGGKTVFGACLCSCNGRGSNLFGKPDHDAASVQRKLGPLGLAGFFCNGEIGPVGQKSFLHGFTASLALFVKK